MTALTPGPLRKPARSGFVGPQAILSMVAVVETMKGTDACETLLKEAQLFRIPGVDEPVREDKAARLHQAVRRLWPDQAAAICRRAGEAAADFVMDHRMPKRAQALLQRMPRRTGAWLLAKSAEQRAWTFGGSGRFEIESAERFLLHDNPVLAGEKADHPVCDYHAGFFERMFTRLIHPDLKCREVACAAMRPGPCVFEFVIDRAEPARP